ncbi:MAG: hypothetical protein D3906_06810 [Candidatus Electrothrix sp. AUS1_2]|nr:hypothetical protein [Candidatus Electrothrix sp. AUS1_2]
MDFKENLEVYRQYGMENFLEWRKSIILNNKEESELVKMEGLRTEISEIAFSILDDIFSEGVNVAEWNGILRRKEALEKSLSDFEKIYLNRYSDIKKDKYDMLERYCFFCYSDNCQLTGTLYIKQCRDIVGNIEKMDNDSDSAGYLERECKFHIDLLDIRRIAYSNN